MARHLSEIAERLHYVETICDYFFRSTRASNDSNNVTRKLFQRPFKFRLGPCFRDSAVAVFDSKPEITRRLFVVFAWHD